MYTKQIGSVIIKATLGIMLFAVANGAQGSCVMLDFTNTSDIVGLQMQYVALNKYDSTGMFKGFLVCTDNNTNPEHFNEKRASGVGYSSVSVSNDNGLVITVYSDDKNVPTSDFYTNSDFKDITIKNIDINGYNATYMTAKECVGTVYVDSETGNESTQPTNIEESINMIQKLNSGGFRSINKYDWVAELYLVIDPRTILTERIRRESPENSLNHFKQIYVTKVTGENPRHLINEGNRFFNEELYEEALSTYDKLEEFEGEYPIRGTINHKHFKYETDDVVDNTGVALYKLGRVNESLKWFDLKTPRSSYTWDLYGQLLKAMNFSEEAEYAFGEASDFKMQEAYMN